MKKYRGCVYAVVMNFLPAVIIIMLSVFAVAGCSKKYSPAAPGQSMATMTPNMTATIEALNTFEAKQTATAAAIETAYIHATQTVVAGLPQATQTAIANVNAAATVNASVTAAAQKTAAARATVFIVTPANTFTATQTPTPAAAISSPVLPLYISSYIYLYDTAGGNSMYSSLNVSDYNNNYITNAYVTLKNLTNSGTVVLPYSGHSGSYSTDSYLDFTPGDVYQLQVYAGGVTYTASAAVQGTDISSDGNTLTWSGNAGAYVYVDDPLGTSIFSQNVSGNSVDISPYYLPGDYGTYNVDVSVDTKTAIAGASSYSSLSIYYNTGWDVEVEAVSSSAQPTSTPVPTAGISINAAIAANDLEGGVSTNVRVNINITNGGTVRDGTVTIKDLTASTSVSCTYNSGEGYYETSELAYTAGHVYEADVSVNGSTYTAKLTAPAANISLSDDCNTISWTGSGNYNGIDVEYYDSLYSYYSQVFYESDIFTNTVDISAAYTKNGEYQVQAGIYSMSANHTMTDYPQITVSSAIFNGTYNSLFYICYTAVWDVSVSNM
jgi:hypothetical protein